MATELSDLIVYCQTKSGGITESKVSSGEMKYYNMASMSDKAMLKVEVKPKGDLNEYHKTVLSRIYPEGSKVLSGNFSPIPHWKAGVQLVALNIQTVGQYSRINNAMFRQNGGSGYVFKKVKMWKD